MSGETLRYRCLVLDHDDTVMESTRWVHYPAFVQGMRVLRPEVHLSLDDFFRMNMDPGIHDYYRRVVRLTDAEYQYEYDVWQSYVRTHVPRVFGGMRRVIERQRAAGGFVCVSSHSVGENILRDYAANGLPAPDLVYGWELPPERRKPAPFALRDIMERLSLAPEELLVVDDLRFGCEMADACGVASAGAGWAYDIPEIRACMERCCGAYFETPAALERWLFSPPV